jgi:hypothetical protein
MKLNKIFFYQNKTLYLEFKIFCESYKTLGKINSNFIYDDDLSIL